MTLLEYKIENRLDWEDFAKLLGLSRRGLMNIVETKSPKTTIATCLKIKKAIGLEPWEYLDGLEHLKHIKENKQK